MSEEGVTVRRWPPSTPGEYAHAAAEAAWMLPGLVALGACWWAARRIAVAEASWQRARAARAAEDPSYRPAVR